MNNKTQAMLNMAWGEFLQNGDTRLLSMLRDHAATQGFRLYSDSCVLVMQTRVISEQRRIRLQLHLEDRSPSNRDSVLLFSEFFTETQESKRLLSLLRAWESHAPSVHVGQYHIANLFPLPEPAISSWYEGQGQVY